MSRFAFSSLIFSVFAAILLATHPASAQTREVPYWASLRANEVNMRVGPSADYRIDWVYKRRGLPVRVVRVMEGWRLVQDPDGTQGWVIARLLNPARGALVTGDSVAAMREQPDAAAQLRWNLAPGVVGMLGRCEEGWCQLDVDGRRGWVEEARLWGVGEP